MVLRFQCIDCQLSLPERNSGINVLVHIERVAELVSNQLGIVMYLIHQRRVRSSHHVEIYPAQANGI